MANGFASLSSSFFYNSHRYPSHPAYDPGFRGEFKAAHLLAGVWTRDHDQLAPSHHLAPTACLAVSKFRKCKRRSKTHCPHCRDTRTEVVTACYRPRGMHQARHRRFCKRRSSTQERAAYWNHIHRKWPGSVPTPKEPRKNPRNALRGHCEVEPCQADFSQAGIGHHVDHIVPARLIRRWKARYSNRREDLQ